MFDQALARIDVKLNITNIAANRNNSLLTLILPNLPFFILIIKDKRNFYPLFKPKP